MSQHIFYLTSAATLIKLESKIGNMMNTEPLVSWMSYTIKKN